MSFLVLLMIAPILALFVGAWSSVPLMLNIWFSSLSGLMVILLFRSGSSAPAVSLFVVEESLSLLVLSCWFLCGGSVFIFFLLTIKSALAPFHSWFVEVLSSCKKEVLGWALSAHKIPVAMFLLSLSSLIGISFLVISIGSGVLFLFGLGEIRSMVVLSSSNVFSSSVMLFWFLGSESAIFFLCYCFIIWSSLMEGPTLNGLFFLVGLMGIPPLLFLQMKWMVLFSLWGYAWGFAFFFILFSALSVIVYIRFCFLMDQKTKDSTQVFFPAWALVSGSLLLL